MIQRLTSPDPARLERLAAVHKAAFEPVARGWSADEIASLTQNGALFADAGDRGFALFSMAADEAELLTVAVHPHHRRLGVARALLQEGLAGAQQMGAATIHLEVAADNLAAIALYEAQGFDVSGRRRGYYGRGTGEKVDAIMMVTST